MRRILSPQFLLVCLVLGAAFASGASAEGGPELIDLRDRLVEATGEDYVQAREEALALSPSLFEELLFLLRQSPKYSLEEILALILEARANHVEEAAQFDANLQNTLDNPDMSGRYGEPIYRLWSSREPKEVHPLIYEALIKLELPGDVRRDIRIRAFLPNPDNIPFILHFAKQYSPGVLFDLVAATEGHPDERQWLRPLAVKMYKEHREAGHALGVHAIVGMFHAFGTPEDLAILKELREFEEKLMPAQNIIIRDRKELGREVHQIRTEYRQRETAIARAEREGAPPHVLVQQRQQLEDVEAVLREAERQSNGNSLWRQLNEDIERLEAQLARKAQGARPAATDHE